MPIGTPVRWERAVHLEGRASSFILYFMTSGFNVRYVCFAKPFFCLRLRGGVVAINAVAYNFSLRGTSAQANGRAVC
jgi:hypothetical protein